jgi:small GTP-binding protein
MPTITSSTRTEPAVIADRGMAILLTAVGVGALGTIRLRGPGVREFLACHLSCAVVDGQAVHGSFSVSGRVIDDPVVGWDALTQQAELHVHGGHWVIHEILQAAGAAGFIVVDRPGLPLPPEAVDATTPLEAEILQWLPLATTREAAASLLGQTDAWMALLSQAQAGQSVDLKGLAAGKALSWLLSPPRIAIVGVPNAGKSTLANALFARERTITADLPGTTRDWIEDAANLDGFPVRLIDTPGLRAAECAIERRAIANAREIIAQVDLVILLLDPACRADAVQSELRATCSDALTVWSKADLQQIDPAEDAALRVSATQGAGMDELRQEIRSRFGCGSLPLSCACVWTARQRSILVGESSPSEAIQKIVGDLL